MSSNITGNAENITTPLSATITNCASGAGGVVEVTTSSAHLFSSEDYVSVSGVTGTTEANTTSEITVVDATHFTMDDVVFVNAYVSGGTATDLSLTPYFQIPSDGDPATAASITSAIQALADRTQYLQHLNGALAKQVITSSRSVTAPLGASAALLVGYGGGGGGGGGQTGSGTDSISAVGGAGGGGALTTSRLVSVTAGTSYAVTIGAGGTGGAASAAGSDGAASTFSSLATFYGGAGGKGASISGNTITLYTVGGRPVSSGSTDAWVIGNDYVNSATTSFVVGPAWGGFGGTGSGTHGAPNPAGFDGGGTGSKGTDNTVYIGGGASGGGGGGPGGAGGAGHNGGNANILGGTAGTTGTAAVANSGGGGGGGSAGGSTNGAGGVGGAGGSGQLTIYWLR